MRTAPTTRRRLLLGIAASALVLVIGICLGRASIAAPGKEVDAPAVEEAGSGGVAAEFPRTESGAADAVAAYQRSFASPRILRRDILRRRIEAVATPAYARRMLTANDPGRQRIASGAIGIGLAEGLRTLYAAVPIGYRIESFSPDQARVLTWGFTLLGNDSTVEPAAYFGLAHTELVWTEDGWRIEGTRAGFGPTPKLATPPGPLGSYEVVDLAAGLKTYASAR